jgi:hypothetical protein
VKEKKKKNKESEKKREKKAHTHAFLFFLFLLDENLFQFCLVLVENNCEQKNKWTNGRGDSNLSMSLVRE